MIFDVSESEHFHIMEWWFNIFGPYWWLFMIFGWMIYFISSIFIAYHVHKDAIKRKIHNVEFWLVITLILNLVGLSLYILVQRNYTKEPNFTKTDNKAI
ncbi:MAG: hypothetical protein ACFE9T_11735 [Promethearchaeota archaeon]